MQRSISIHVTLLPAVFDIRPLLRLGVLGCLCCLVGAVSVHTYTPPATPTVSPGTRGRYPIGYDPDNRSRPANLFPASHILTPKTEHPPAWTPAWTRTRGEAKSARWAPPPAYDPRRRPPLRSTDTSVDLMMPLVSDVDNSDSSVCPLPDCALDPRTHICTGIWMGRTIVERRCQKLQ
jgi:hypothetical protein